MIFYKAPNYHKNKKFNFFIDVIFEDINKKDLEVLLNKKKLEESGILRTCMTVYERSGARSTEKPR